MAGDLYMDGAYITIAEALDLYQVGPGQFLQYTKMSHTVRGIWTSFLTLPVESEVLGMIIEPGSNRRLILRFNEELKKDRQIKTEGLHETWNRE